MKIAVAKNKDLETLCKLHAESVRYAAQDYYTDQEIEAWACKDPTRYKKYLKNQQIVILKIGHMIAGFGITDFNHKEILAIYVDPQYFGRGCGSLLLSHCEISAANANIPELILYSSLNAKSFYENSGYMIVEQCKMHLESAQLSCFKMRKRLP